ncbi:MAG: TetR/AcrR family transcriptional regulator, partial [Dehalococcoidia bacterium]
MEIIMRIKHSRRLQQHQNTRVRLMKAALGVFSRKGFEDTSVEDICLAAGYSKGGFYFHFKGKDELLVNLLDEVREVAGLSSVSERPSALMVELWSQAARKEELGRLLRERHAIRRGTLRTAAKRAGISPVRAAARVEMLLALEAGLDIQAELLLAYGDVSRV